MQVSAQPRHASIGGRYRPQGSESLSAIAAVIERPSGRDGGQPGGSEREDRQGSSDPRIDKGGHKTVFVARSLSLTLTELQIASLASEFGTTFSRVDTAPVPPASTVPASLDDLLSVFLSAA